jgi:hypothetical protein
LPTRNDPNQGGSGALAELFRLQTEFSARLADETLRYLRRLQGAVAPAAPGTIVLQDPDLLLSTSGPRGGVADLVVEVENLQRVHCLVRPQLTALVSSDGATWFPEADPSNMSKLVAPGETAELRLQVKVAPAVPAGEYRGALLLEGFREQGLPVLVTVQAGPATSAAKSDAGSAEAKPAATRKAAAAKPAATRPAASAATTPKPKTTPKGRAAQASPAKRRATPSATPTPPARQASRRRRTVS